MHETFSALKEEVKKIVDVDVNERTNRVVAVLDDVFQLMSLALLTVGLNRTAPANYASLATLQRLLEHLSESSTYTDADIEPIRQRLREIKSIVERSRDETDEDDDDFTSPEIIRLIEQKLAHCDGLLQRVEASMQALSPELEPLMQKLVLLRREIMSVGSKPNFNPSLLRPLQESLRKIESSRNADGLFVGSDGNPIAHGQATVNGLLEKCHTLITDFSAAHGDQVDEELKPVYSQLVELKNTLENLLVTHRWTLRETDLYFYQKQLQKIDDMRVNGVFQPHATATATDSTATGTATELAADNAAGSGSAGGPPPPRGQTILLYLLRRCYAIIYKLLESSEPVSEALTPVHNQLSTVRQCLLDVKRMGGLSSVRELYPYQMKLASIDSLRVDGKFMVGESVPEGQGMLNALLAECFDICHELKVEMDETPSSSSS